MGHREAQAIGDAVVTTEEVLTEYLTCFSRSSQHFRRKAAATVREFCRTRRYACSAESRNFLAAVELYSARPDKG